MEVNDTDNAWMLQVFVTKERDATDKMVWMDGVFLKSMAQKSA